mmetsp:Transcript_75125/g.125237  ORF Transcript_75125/g.125237 Transcript_75125/m.125237 type:complete len:309 (-) Transcript_75125:23-949(-)
MFLGVADDRDEARRATVARSQLLVEQPGQCRGVHDQPTATRREPLHCRRRVQVKYRVDRVDLFHLHHDQTVARFVRTNDLKTDVWWQQELVLLRVQTEGADIPRDEGFLQTQRVHGALPVLAQEVLQQVGCPCYRREGGPLDLITTGQLKAKGLGRVLAAPQGHAHVAGRKLAKRMEEQPDETAPVSHRIADLVPQHNIHGEVQAVLTGLILHGVQDDGGTFVLSVRSESLCQLARLATGCLEHHATGTKLGIPCDERRKSFVKRSDGQRGWKQSGERCAEFAVLQAHVQRPTGEACHGCRSAEHLGG